MLKMFSKRMNNKKGFTLIELIVVIAILGILGAITVPKFGGFRESAAEKADKATAATIANAARLYYAENPPSSEISEKVEEPTGQNSDRKYLEYLENVPTPQAKDKNAFWIKVGTDGNVEVYYDNGNGEIGTDQLYPAQ